MNRSRPPEAIHQATRLELAALESEVRARRLQIFRTHLARTIRLASPLLIDACRPEELDEAVWRVRPTERWPHGLDPQVVLRDWSAWTRRRDKNCIHSSSRPAGDSFFGMDQLVLRIRSNGAHMLFQVGSIALVTAGGGGYLSLPYALDNDQRTGLIGATLDSVFKHPIATDRPYPIVGISPHETSSMTLLRFEASPVEWHVPWARPWEMPF